MSNVNIISGALLSLAPIQAQVYALSSANLLTRSNIEVALLTQLIERTLQQQMLSLARDGVCLKVIGNREQLPVSLQSAISR